MIIKMYPNNVVTNKNLNKPSQACIMSLNDKIQKNKAMKEIQIPKEVKALIRDFQEANSPLALVKALDEKVSNTKGMEEISLNSFKFGDFKIDSMITNFADNLIKKINTAIELKLKTAPIFAKQIKSNIGESLVISKVNGLKNAKLVPASELDTFSSSAKKVIEKDMETLQKNGYVLPGISKENILVDEKTGLPKLINLESLKKAISSKEISEFKETVKEL